MKQLTVHATVYGVPPTPRPRHGALVRNRLSLIPLLLTLVTVAFAGAPAVAGAASDKAIYTDCTDGTLDGTYTTAQLQKALRELEANTSEYAECSDAIYGYLQNQASGKGGGSSSSSGGSSSSTGGGTGTTSGSGGAQGTTTTPSGGTSTTGSSSGAPALTKRETDARDADATEKAAAVAAATASADKKAGKQAEELKNTGVPAAALQYGGASDTSLPTPLLMTLVACVLAACVAGAATGVQAVRRRRGR